MAHTTEVPNIAELVGYGNKWSAHSTHFIINNQRTGGWIGPRNDPNVVATRTTL
jgi:hypothetical protein